MTMKDKQMNRSSLYSMTAEATIQMSNREILLTNIHTLKKMFTC